MVGKKVNAGLLSFKGADLTIDFFLTYADVNCTPADIKTWTQNEGVELVEVEEVPQRHSHFKSFRICVRKKDVETIKNEDFWPEGIHMRKFFHKAKNNGVTTDPSSQ